MGPFHRTRGRALPITLTMRLACQLTERAGPALGPGLLLGQSKNLSKNDTTISCFDSI